MRKLFLIIATMLMSGCATAPPTQDEIANADYGAAPPAAYQNDVKQYFAESLKDPESVKYKEITAPEKGWVTLSFVEGGGRVYGWLVRATINAKNSYGGYIGYTTYSFLFRNGKLVQVVKPQSD